MQDWINIVMKPSRVSYLHVHKLNFYISVIKSDRLFAKKKILQIFKCLKN